MTIRPQILPPKKPRRMLGLKTSLASEATLQRRVDFAERTVALRNFEEVKNFKTHNFFRVYI